ncbi:MAG: OmpA family protein [Lachnospiraceae bacterium]|nr:OmpA family protein [Lachnospiraceae bacterium]
MRAKRKKNYERHNVWRSYSDMMAGLLLLFLLVMCISFMQAQKNYQDRLDEESAHAEEQSLLQAQLDEKEALLLEQESELDEQAALLASQQESLDVQSALLSQQESELNEQAALVASQQVSLDEQSALVAEQESELEEQEALLASQQESLDEQEALLASQQESLDEQEALLTAQQEKIEQIIGVKADLIAALKTEFAAQSLSVTIDETDGSIVLDSSVLFGYNENILTEEGSELLGELLPTYCSVLMSEEYVDYLAEIRIDGYTDTSGTYFYNLQLSQERALAVAEYLLSLTGSSISEEDMTALQEKLSVNGHSWADPVYNDDGTINADASRRVEIKFRLKDEEMINDLKEILDETS